MYFLSFLFLKGLTLVLGFAGKAGMELATNLWGINFIFSAIIAIMVRKIIDALKLGYVLDDNSLTRISGMAVDYMVAGALAAISLVFVGKYWFPIVLMSTLCGFMVYYTLPWVCSRIFRDFRFERMLMLYGVSTGTLSTGLALLRVMDPEFKTKVSSDYMLSAGLTFVLAIPFILTINLPAKAYTTGSMTPFWIFMGIAVAYQIFVTVIYLILARKRRFAMPSDNFYRPCILFEREAVAPFARAGGACKNERRVSDKAALVAYPPPRQGRNCVFSIVYARATAHHAHCRHRRSAEQCARLR